VTATNDRPARPWEYLVGLLVIATVLALTHVRAIRHGMCFDEPSWLFHFGHRILNGDVPYRDFVFTDGPLPVWLDAGFQRMLGAKYYASLYAGLFVEILRVFGVWTLARRFADGRAAALLAVACAVDPMFSDTYHAAGADASLFVTAAGLWIVLAARSEVTRARVYLAFAGVSLALLVATQAGTGLVAAALLAIATISLARRREAFTADRLISLWGAFAIGVIGVVVALGGKGALGGAFQQLVIDAWDKRDGFGFDLLVTVVLPAIVVGGTVIAAARDEEVSASTLGVLLAPIALVIALGLRYGRLDVFVDVPTALFAVTTALAISAPTRLRAWFGVEPMIAIGLGTLPMAAGVTSGADASVLVIAAILFALASSNLTRTAKTSLAAAFVVVAAVHGAVNVYEGRQLFARRATADGLRSETVVSSRNHSLRGIKLSRARRRGLELLEASVPARRTCFIHGDLPVLYTLLQCTNPTRIDATGAHFITDADAKTALDSLQRTPPDYLVVHDGWQGSNVVFEQGLRVLLSQYDSIGPIGVGLGPLAPRAAAQHDVISAVHVYRRKGAN
jgi:hypothetical protein